MRKISRQVNSADAQILVSTKFEYLKPDMGENGSQDL